MVSWKEITKPTRRGGLGVRIARYQNVSLLGKLIWELLSGSNKLWVKVLQDKYMKDCSIFGTHRRNGSSTWLGILKALPHLQGGFSYEIGKGGYQFLV